MTAQIIHLSYVFGTRQNVYRVNVRPHRHYEIDLAYPDSNFRKLYAMENGDKRKISIFAFISQPSRENYTEFVVKNKEEKKNYRPISVAFIRDRNLYSANTLLIQQREPNGNTKFPNRER